MPLRYPGNALLHVDLDRSVLVAFKFATMAAHGNRSGFLRSETEAALKAWTAHLNAMGDPRAVTTTPPETVRPTKAPRGLGHPPTPDYRQSVEG